MEQHAAGRGLPRLNTDLKLAVRIHLRYQRQGEAAGLAYATALIRQQPHMADKLYALMPAARAQSVREAVAEQPAGQAARQAVQAAQQQAEETRRLEAEQARLDAVRQDLETARL